MISSTRGFLFASWHSRVESLSVPGDRSHLFAPFLDTLSFAVLLNAQAVNNGFTLALFSSSIGSNPYHISIQGFTKESRTLQRPVQGIEELPEILWELVGLVLEARGGTSKDEILSKVRDVVGSLFQDKEIMALFQ
ncbi:hypothetical protein J132_09390 [Termitomyces sp. J132]|nr:hypothetical protein J132_09390 [Termitomyces sp. J132]